MAIPDYQSLMLPLLRFAADDQEHSVRETIAHFTQELGLTDMETQELLPSGRQATFDNRVGWARTYLAKACLLSATRRGYFQITARGHELLATQPASITLKILEVFPEFAEFRAQGREQNKAVTSVTADLETPVELLETAYQQIRDTLATELLQTIKNGSPGFFERLVIDLLVAMGYGGSRKEAGQAIGRSGDEGIDGIINEDRLGLDVIYIQAKRWQGVVGRPEIQKFVGALQGYRARKGVFLTTSSFTQEAQDYVMKIEAKIILIDGNQLSDLMIDHNVGVVTIASYETKKIDGDYFAEE